MDTAILLTHSEGNWYRDEIVNGDIISIEDTNFSGFFFRNYAPLIIYDKNKLERGYPTSVVIKNDTITITVKGKNDINLNSYILYPMESPQIQDSCSIFNLYNYNLSIADSILIKNHTGININSNYKGVKILSLEIWQDICDALNPSSRETAFQNIISSFKAIGIYDDQAVNTFYIGDTSSSYKSLSKPYSNLIFIGNTRNQYVLTHEIFHNCYECILNNRILEDIIRCGYGNFLMSLNQTTLRTQIKINNLLGHHFLHAQGQGFTDDGVLDNNLVTPCMNNTIAPLFHWFNSDIPPYPELYENDYIQDIELWKDLYYIDSVKEKDIRSNEALNSIKNKEIKKYYKQAYRRHLNTSYEKFVRGIIENPETREKFMPKFINLIDHDEFPTEWKETFNTIMN